MSDPFHDPLDPPRAPDASPSVLVVGRDPVSVARLSQVLARLGYRAAQSSDAEEARACLDRLQADVTVLCGDGQGGQGGQGGQLPPQVEVRPGAAADWQTLAPPAPAALDIAVGPLVVSPASRTVTLGGVAVHVTPTEYRLLYALASQPGVAIPRDSLSRLLSSAADAALFRSLDVHVRRLRAKLRAAGGGPCLVAVRGFGYRLVCPPATGPDPRGIAS